MIRISCTGDLHDANHGGLGAVGVIEKRQITLFHLIAHEVARLIVAYTIPVVSLAFLRAQVINGIHIWLAFH